MKTIEVTQVKSAIGRLSSHKACLRGLGIKRMHKPTTVLATVENLGMIRKISYMLRIEER
jgi:ribosomal protein L15/ribosomal protein L30